MTSYLNISEAADEYRYNIITHKISNEMVDSHELDEILFTTRQKHYELQEKKYDKMRIEILKELRPSKLLFDNICDTIEKCDKNSNLFRSLCEYIVKNGDDIILFTYYSSTGYYTFNHNNYELKLPSDIETFNITIGDLIHDCPYTGYTYEIENELFEGYKIIGTIKLNFGLNFYRNFTIRLVKKSSNLSVFEYFKFL